MSKVTISNYIFNPAAQTITFPGYPKLSSQGTLLLITNATLNTDIYLFNSQAKGAVISGNVATLTYDTTAMSSSDDLIIYYDDGRASQTISTTQKKFRDGFDQTGVDTSVWTLTNTDSHLITAGGNSTGSSYLRISLNPLIDASEVTLTSKEVFSMPMRIGYGLSMSQRIVGQEVFIGVAADDGAGGVDTSMTKWNGGSDMVMPASVTVTVANTIPIVIANHGLNGGDRVCVYGCADSRMNIGPAVVTVVDANTFTIPGTAAIATYTTTGGFIRFADPLRSANNGAGYLFENATANNASMVSRRNGGKFRSLNFTHATTTATQTNTSPYTDAFNAAGSFEQQISLDEVAFRSFTADSGGAPSGFSKYTQGIPDEAASYHLHVRARTLTGFTRPVAKITSIAKTGTTTATVTTSSPHGLATTDWVQIYGIKDQTNFPNLTAQTQIASTPTSTTFTIVIGAAVTASSTEGVVWRVQGGTLAPGVFTQVVQSLSVTNNILSLVGNGTWATPIPGEMLYVYGLSAALSAYEGAYKVLRVSTTILELAPAAGGSLTTITSTATGGAVMRMTDVRLHFSRSLDHTRVIAEISGGRGNISDLNNAVPTVVTGSATLPVSQSTGSNTTQWSAAGWGGFLVADVASAAITATATTAATSPGSVVNVGTYAHSFNIPVTVVSGTNPTLDVQVQESTDNGTNWLPIYDFERITATGSYTSPLIRSQYGTRFRYVQTISGTTPSFTRAINRVQFSQPGQLIRRFLDRSVVLTTLSSTTPTYNIEGCDMIELIVAIGAVTTTAPAIQLEGSETGITTEFYAIGTPVTGVASTAVRSVFTNELPKFVRARVSTAGVGVTANYVGIKAIGR